MNKRRVLVLTPRFPYPTIGGDRIRIVHVCKALSTQFSLTLLSLCETREEMRYEPQDGVFTTIRRVYLPRWKSYWNAARALPGRRPLQLAYYESEEFRRQARSAIAEHDLVIAHLVRSGQYVADCDVPAILEMTDAISMNYLRLGQTSGNRSWKKMLYLLEQPRLERYEKGAMQRFDRVWLTSHADRLFLDPEREWPVEVIPNGTELEELPFHPPVAPGNVIVFIGNMVSLQNQDACHWFVREVLPRLRAQAPVVFRIVGNAPSAVRRRFARCEGVEMTGRIEHIRDGAKDAFCGVCPVRAAAGIQNKVLEYLALGLPCVTSELGMRGVEARAGEQVLVYRDAAEMAEEIAELHRNRELRLRLAAAGRQLVEQRYNWRNIYRDFVASALEATMLRGQARDVQTAA